MNPQRLVAAVAALAIGFGVTVIGVVSDSRAKDDTIALLENRADNVAGRADELDDEVDDLAAEAEQLDAQVGEGSVAPDESAIGGIDVDGTPNTTPAPAPPPATVAPGPPPVNSAAPSNSSPFPCAGSDLTALQNIFLPRPVGQRDVSEDLSNEDFGDDEEVMVPLDQVSPVRETDDIDIFESIVARRLDRLGPSKYVDLVDRVDQAVVGFAESAQVAGKCEKLGDLLSAGQIGLDSPELLCGLASLSSDRELYDYLGLDAVASNHLSETSCAPFAVRADSSNSSDFTVQDCLDPALRAAAASIGEEVAGLLSYYASKKAGIEDADVMQIFELIGPRAVTDCEDVRLRAHFEAMVSGLRELPAIAPESVNDVLCGLVNLSGNDEALQAVQDVNGGSLELLVDCTYNNDLFGEGQ